MPVYEYQCNACDHKFELLQSVNARPEETSCPQCNEVNAQRLMSAFASQIKGDHKTGFREMKAYDMYNERMDKFKKLPPLMGGARAIPDSPRMTQPTDSGSGES
jgi:putative FmdB family regulatory protein